MVANLKLLRTKHGVSQQQLARALGVSQQSINKYENHGVEPDISTLIAMARYFDTTVDYLIGNTSDQNHTTACRVESLSTNEAKLLEVYRLLDTRGKMCVWNFIETYNK